MGTIIEELKAENFCIILRTKNRPGFSAQLCIISVDETDSLYWPELTRCLLGYSSEDIPLIVSQESLDMYVMLYPHYEAGLKQLSSAKKIAKSEALAAWGGLYWL